MAEVEPITEAALLAGMRHLGPPVAFRRSPWRAPAPPKKAQRKPRGPQVVQLSPRQDHDSPASHLIRCVCEEFAVTRDQFLSNDRRRDVVAARHAAMFLLHISDKTRRIGLLARLLHRNHATIIYGIKRARDLMKKKPKYLARIEKLHLHVMGAPLPHEREEEAPLAQAA